MGDGFEAEDVLVKKDETVAPETALDDAISNQEKACFDFYLLRCCCMRFERIKLFILFFVELLKLPKDNLFVVMAPCSCAMHGPL